MSEKMRWHNGWKVSVVLIATLFLRASTPSVAAEDRTQQTAARQILDATGVKGGLIVHIGCGDGDLTAALRANDSFMVHGLAATDDDLAAARRTVQTAGAYGNVSIDRLTGDRLPYIDNLVNLIVVEAPGQLDMDEVMRVVCPGGIAYIKQGGGWTKSVKPRPGEIDEWTHYMYDAKGNAVSNDTEVGPPARLQWVGSPLWSRHHEHLSSVSAVVSSAGRVFYIFDEGSRASIQLPAKWKLIARDAFNGVVLWKRDIPLWYTHLYPLKSGPAFLPRRLVSIGDVVYATLGLDQPLVALDAATGETIRTYENTQATEEVLCSDGVLFLLVNKRPMEPDRYTWNNPVCWTEDARVDKERPWDQQQRTILAVEAATGKTLWSKDAVVVPVTLSVDDRRAVFHDGEKVVCLDRKTGRRKWTSEEVAMRLPLPTCFAPTLVLYDGVVLFAGGNGQMSGYDAETGEKLWTGKHYRAGHRSPEDVLVIDGLAWTGELAGRGSNTWTGYNIKTGVVEREFQPDIESYWFHHRCHRSKATTRYLLPSRTGIEFVDWKAETWNRNHWVRGACVYGIMPCNGLVYAPQHPCACYMETKLNGFNALAPAAKEPLRKPTEDARLEKGPAYGQDTVHHSSFILPRTGRPIATTRHAAAASKRSSVPISSRPGKRTSAAGSAARWWPKGSASWRRSTRTRSTPWTPPTARKYGNSPPAGASIRRRRSTTGARFSAAPTGTSTAFAPPTANWRGDIWPRRPIGVTWRSNNSKASGPSTVACWCATAWSIAWRADRRSSTAGCASAGSTPRRAGSSPRRSSTRTSRARRTTSSSPCGG